MTKNERFLQMIGKDVFTVANAAAYHDVEFSDELDEFRIAFFENENVPLDYSFDELKGFAMEVLDVIKANPIIACEPSVKFSLSELKKLANKTEKEMLVEKADQIDCWDDMDNISACGGLAGFLSKHAKNPEFLAAQDVIRSLFG